MAQSLTQDPRTLRARLAADPSFARKAKLILEAAGAARLCAGVGGVAGGERARGDLPAPRRRSEPGQGRGTPAAQRISAIARPDSREIPPRINRAPSKMVRWGRIERALWLLERDADPNLPDQRGWTAVHQAASRGNERIFRALVAAGGDVARKDHEGRTPLQVANLKTRRNLAAVRG